MAAPDTSFQPPVVRFEEHPGMETREHPASATLAGGPGSYLQEIQRLAIEANLVDVLDERAANRQG
jgi:hypothetical protein